VNQVAASVTSKGAPGLAFETWVRATDPNFGLVIVSLLILSKNGSELNDPGLTKHHHKRVRHNQTRSRHIFLHRFTKSVHLCSILS
jgi:hypothetical protein